MIRLLQVVVVVFWLATTAWLLRSSWFPDESRFVTVELREVMDAIFINWHETAELVVLGEGRRIGQMSISASSSEASLASEADVPARRLFSSTGALSEFGQGAESTRPAGGQAILVWHDRLFWRGHLDLDEQYQFAGFDGVLRFPEQGMRVELGYQLESKQLHARVDMNGVTMLNYDGAIGDLSSSSAEGVPKLAMPFPMSTAVLSLLGEEVEPWLSALGLSASQGELPSVSDLKARLEEAGLVVTTKFGRTTIADQRMAVYLISIGSGDPDSTLKIYIGEDGRPVKVDAPFDYSALAEVLAPEYWLEENGPIAAPE